jgi:CDP-paratose 2-epimerase
MRARAASAPILITGGAGFIGSNIADALAAAGHEILVYDSLARAGVERNLEWLRERHGARIVPVVADIRDEDELRRAAAGVQAVFHMAAQVAVTTSLADPREDFEVNLGGTLNLLDALRMRREPVPLIFASTNKVYGDLADIPFVLEDGSYVPGDGRVRAHGIDETRPLDFHTPYGCSKGAADQYVLDYCRSFGLPTAVVRMSCIYGRRQMGTEDQGWVAHFLIRALEREPITLYGDGCQVRDILDISNAVDAYLAAWRRIDRIAGRAFNLGGGPANAVSLRELIAYIAGLTDRDVAVRHEDWRAGDQRYFVADTRKARGALGLTAPVPWRDGVARLAEWLESERRPAKPVPPRAALEAAEARA